ncbi:MAG: hypothetical protein JW947_04725 [Sedimentisphaerales bacterium]|nr:hypothetical protein [Sedimentisphaerales bacterium]
MVCSMNVSAVPPVWNIIQLTDNYFEFDEYNPKISGSNVAWNEWFENDEEEGYLLLFFNGSTITQLSDRMEEYDDTFKISGSNVAWTEYNDVNGVLSLFLYNDSTITKLSENLYDEESYKFSGSNIAWTEYDEEYDDVNLYLFIYNGSNITKLSDKLYEAEYFEFSGSNVLWLEYDEDNDLRPLFFYNGSTITKLANDIDDEDEDYKFSGSNVIWEDYNDDEEVYSLCFFNGSTITKLADSQELYIYSFQISGSNAAWDAYDEANDTLPLFFYNGATVTKLSDHFNEEFYRVSESSVVWTEYNDVDWTESLFFYNGTDTTKLSDNIEDYGVRTSGSNVVWMEYDEYNDVTLLFFYNGSTITKLSDNIGYDEIYQISGSNVIWAEPDEVNDTTPLFFYNGSTVTKLSDNVDTYDETLRISGSTVIWFEWDEVNDVEPLFAYNGTTIAKLSSRESIYNPMIFGSNVVWTEYDGYSDVTVLMIYNGSTVTKLGEIDGEESYRICDSNIVWGASTWFSSKLFFAKPMVGLQVTLGPTAAVLDGAQWNIDGGDWQDSDAVIIDLSAGWHTVNYKQIIGWVEPLSESVFVDRWTITSLSQYYLPKPGNLAVTLGPGEAVSAGAQWNVDGGGWQNSGVVLNGLMVGSHTVNYKSVTGWDAPVSEAIIINRDETTSINRNYTPKSTYLKITLGPVEAVSEGAKWNIDGGDWQDSGDIVTGLSAGLHTVNYKSIDGWTAPASESITINEGSGTHLSRDYTPQPGGIGVTLGPADAVLEGAQWNVDGGDWQDGGATVTDLAAGSHTVNYKSIAGWFAPASESVTVNRGTTTSISRDYTPMPGNLQITLGPAEAVSEGARWNVDGGAWQNSGATVTGLTAGSHTVNYTSVTGWFTPASESVTINRGVTTSISRNYTPQPGNLQITLGPADAVSEGAQWNVDGGEWQNSGAEVTDLAAGSHTVNYKSIAGWFTPASESVTINRGATTSVSRNYTPQPGNLQITLGPADAVSEGTQWNVDDGAWQNSGATVTGLTAGSHTVNYKSVTGWFTPSSESVTINRGVTTSISRNYTPQPGSIQILLWPIDAFLDGVQWNVDGGEWQDSGAEVTDLPAGSHTVNYKTIVGWNAPASESVTVNRGTKTSLNRDYAELPGNLEVTLGPAGAVSEGAQWSVDGGAWQNSGATIMGLSAGLHTLRYKSLTGWHTPGSESVTVNRGTTTSISRNYIEFPGGIKITLVPADAVTAGAQWNVDGGGWQDSGAEVTGLSPGLHTVNYKAIAGWIAHPSEVITVNRSMTIFVSRSYIPQARGLVVNKSYISAGSGINDDDDVINCSGIIGITSDELRGSYEITVKIGGVYSEAILVSSFISENGKFTYTYRIPKGEQGRITSLVIDTNKHIFSLKAREINLSGLHCPFNIEFDTDNYWGFSSIYENTANGKRFVPVQLMSGVNDYLQVQSIKIKKGRLSDTLKIKGGIAYEVLPTSINNVVLKLGSQTFTIPAKNFKPSGKSGFKYVCKNTVIPGGIAGATFDFGKCTFTITINKTKINTTTGIVGLTLAIGGFNEQVNFDLDTGQAI